MKVTYVERIIILHVLLLGSSESSASSYFWLITPPEGAPTYLFGTIHVPYSKLADAIPDNVKEALERSDGFGWMELDFGDPTDPKYGQHQHYPGGPPKEPLFDHKLASLFKSRNKSLHALEFHVEQSAYREYMRMVIQHMKIELDAELEEEDNKFMDIAVSKLELGRLLKDPDLIDEGLRMLGRMPEISPENMLADYLDGKVNSSIYSAMGKLGYPLALNPIFEKGYSQLMSQRNKNMAARVQEIISENPSKSHFLAVGVHHLLGVGKTQDHLTAAGFIVSRIPPGVKLADLETSGPVKLEPQNQDEEIFSQNFEGEDQEGELSVTAVIGSVTDDQVMRTEAEKTFDKIFQMERIDGILRLLEPAYGRVDLMENVVDKECGKYFIKASDDLLATIFLQVMYEVPLPEENDVIYLGQTWMRLVQKILCQYGELDLQGAVDDLMNRYVLTAGTAAMRAFPLEEAAAAIRNKMIKPEDVAKNLGTFLDEALDDPKFDFYQSKEVSRKYLTVVVLKMVFYIVKEMAVHSKKFDNLHELSNFQSEQKGKSFNLRPGYIRELTRDEIADDIDKLEKNSKDGHDFAEKLEKYKEDNAEKIFEFWGSNDPIAPDTRNPNAKSNRRFEEEEPPDLLERDEL